jgi:hypothetical protein
MIAHDLIRQQIDALLKDVREQHDRMLTTLADALAQGFASESDELRRRAAEEANAAKADAESRLQAIQQEGAARLAQVEADAAARIAAARADAQTEFAPQIAAARLEAAAETERARAEADALKTRLSDLERDRDAAAQAAAARLAEVERARDAQVASMKAEIANVLRQPAAPAFGPILAGLREIDAARTLTEVLDALVAQCGREAPRAAVLLIQGDRVRGWKTTGFPSSLADAASVEFALTDGGIVAGAARTGTRTSSAASGGPGATAPQFASLPPDRLAVAVPVVVGSHVVAMVYADAGGEAGERATAGWPDAVEILVRHAARALEAVTLSKAASLSRVATDAGNGSPDSPEDAAKRYAKLLVAEIKLYHQAAVDAGRAARDLGERLAPQIARARSMYQERIGPDVPARMTYFDQELVATLADGDPQLLGAARSGLPS